MEIVVKAREWDRTTHQQARLCSDHLGEIWWCDFSQPPQTRAHHSNAGGLGIGSAPPLCAHVPWMPTSQQRPENSPGAPVTCMRGREHTGLAKTSWK